MAQMYILDVAHIKFVGLSCFCFDQQIVISCHTLYVDINQKYTLSAININGKIIIIEIIKLIH